jgi:NADH-quinone oxidoreductase subunit L
MRRMGGLYKLLPITFAVMTIGNIAITGLGIPGFDLGFAGFYSKDAILSEAFAAGATQPFGYFAYVIGTLVAGLTGFYSWRLAFMTFNGQAHWGEIDHHGDDPHGAPAHPDTSHASDAQIETHSEPDTHGGHDQGHGDVKPHESPWTMLVPLLVLSVGAIAAGFVFAPYFIGRFHDAFWRGAIFVGPHNHVLEQAEDLPLWVGLAPLVCSILGLLFAAYYYLWHRALAARIAADDGLLYRFLYNKWYFDELYQLTFVAGAKALGDLFWKTGDQAIIDGLGPNGVAKVSAFLGGRLGKVQTGYLYHYAFVMLLGVAGLLTYAIATWIR